MSSKKSEPRIIKPGGGKGKPPVHNRGGRRGEREEAEILDAVEFLLDHKVGREGISLALADQYGAPMLDEKRRPVLSEGGKPKGEPIPLSTVHGWIVKVNERWEAEVKYTREQTRKRQLRRLYRRLRDLKGAGKYREAADLERLVARIEGNEVPKTLKLTGADGGPVKVQSVLTSDERRKRTADLMAQARARAAGTAPTPSKAEAPPPSDDTPPDAASPVE